VTEDEEPIAGRATLPGGTLFALALSTVAAVGLSILVAATDPGPREEQLFILLLLVLVAGVASAGLLLFGLGSLRAFRRGLLLGLAVCGAAVLQMNASLSAPNLAFVLLVLLIVELIFLARRQNPA